MGFCRLASLLLMNGVAIMVAAAFVVPKTTSPHRGKSLITTKASPDFDPSSMKDIKIPDVNMPDMSNIKMPAMNMPDIDLSSLTNLDSLSNKLGFPVENAPLAVAGVAFLLAIGQKQAGIDEGYQTAIDQIISGKINADEVREIVGY